MNTGELEEAFSQISDDEINALRSLSQKPMLLGFVVLELATKMGIANGLTSDQICKALLAAGISKKSTQIINAFKNAGERLHREQQDGETIYYLMGDGRDEILGLLDQQHLTVYGFEPGKPHSEKGKLGTVLNDLSGDLLVFDPYYGVKSLETLALIPSDKKVSFLTSQLSKGESEFKTRLKDFQKEYPHIEIRKLNKKIDQHDRYIISDDSFVLMGHGIKDIGTKESFMVLLANSIAPTLIKEQRDKFNELWQQSGAIN